MTHDLTESLVREWHRSSVSSWASRRTEPYRERPVLSAASMRAIWLRISGWRRVLICRRPVLTCRLPSAELREEPCLVAEHHQTGLHLGPPTAQARFQSHDLQSSGEWKSLRRRHTDRSGQID